MYAMPRSLTVLPRAKAAVTSTVVGLLLLFGLAACQTLGGPRTASSKLAFNIQPSRTSILEGENVTFTTYTSNLVGTQANIKWTSTGGHLRTYRNGDTARVEFQNPGTYTVFADLFVDGTRMKTDQATIRVKPTHRGGVTKASKQGNNGSQGRNRMGNQGNMQGQSRMRGQDEMQGSDNNMSNLSPQQPPMQNSPRSGNQNGMSQPNQPSETPGGQAPDDNNANPDNMYK